MFLPIPLLEQLLVKEIAVGPAFGIKPGARIAAPVSGTAYVRASLEYTKAHLELSKSIGRVHAGNTATNDNSIVCFDGLAHDTLQPSIRPMFYRADQTGL